MAEQTRSRNRPFMPKHTFDQVSAVMWGEGALDYHTNYIVPRTHWDDSDIRDEAYYFAILAHGLRVGASQKPSQPMMHQGSCKDQSSVPVNVNSDQMGSSNSAHLAPAKHGSLGAESQPQVAPHAGPSHRPGVATPLQNAPNSGGSWSNPFDSGKAYQRASTTAVTGAGQEIGKPFGGLSAGSQPSVAAGRGKSIMNPLFENIPESIFGEDFGEEYHEGYTPSTLEEDSDQEACYEEMERFFAGEEVEDADLVSDTEGGTYGD